ncbi:MAG: hypothetical protein KGY61_00325 [Desulfobacterales bacterium]|nr:hypothetical protein [Desulfobacterales bacterium]
MAIAWIENVSYRKRRALPILFIAGLIGVSAFIALGAFPFSAHKRPSPSKIHYEKDMAATGLSFVEFEDSQKKSSFKIKKITVSKKQLGFLRLGFARVAEIDDFEMRVYLDTGEKTDPENAIDVEKLLLAGKSAHSMPLDNIKELKIRDFSAKFFKSGVLAASIKSDRAGMAVYQKDLEFSGHIVLRAENGRVLKCESMEYSRADKKFQIRGDFRLKSEETVIDGKGMVTDLFLESIEGSRIN